MKTLAPTRGGPVAHEDSGTYPGHGRGLDVAMFTEHTSMNMAIRHKHLKLDQTKIDTARRLLGLSTEQETVETALDLVIAEEPILRAHRKVKGVGGVVDLFGAR